MSNLPDEAKIEMLRIFQFYEKDVNTDLLIVEYRLFLQGLSLMDSKPQGIHQIFLRLIDIGYDKMYPNLARLYRLILTLPATSCSCERSFLALKFVKNNLRTTMTQERLNDLMILAVEAEIKTSSSNGCRGTFLDESGSQMIVLTFTLMQRLNFIVC